MRSFALVVFVASLLGAACAGEVGAYSFDDAFMGFGRGRSLRAVSSAPVGFELPSIALGQDYVYDSWPSRKQKFGAGAALGLAGDPIGIGLTAWFEYYFRPYVAVGGNVLAGYGGITDPYQNGGDASYFGFALGVKAVLDVESVFESRLIRPWVAFYPLGLVLVSATEDYDVPGTGNTDDFDYSDVFFLIYGGIGTDFYFTDNVGLGGAIYVTGTIGGSKHTKDGVNIETKGNVGIYVEYLRLSVRF